MTARQSIVTATKTLQKSIETMRALGNEIKRNRALMLAALHALRYHTEQTRPIENTNAVIAALEKELSK